MALHSDRERYSRCKGRNLELQIWKLGLRHRTALNAMGCPRFIEIKLELAIQYIIHCLLHRLFRNRMQLTYRSRNDKFESGFNHYMRQLAKKSTAMDHHESASGTSADGFDSTWDGGASRANQQGIQRHHLKTQQFFATDHPKRPLGKLLALKLCTKTWKQTQCTAMLKL